MTSYVNITLENSEIRGIEKTSLNGRKYYSFLGIPYAKPPVGDLRFKAPQPLENIPKNLDATRFKNACIQFNELDKMKIGSEDCLYLNVFIPKLPSSECVLPVMVYFHGGAYRHQSANMITPHLLIEHDIIVVTFNYRLHALGFLNLGLPDCPGNVGLKDQFLVLKWVEKNIQYFGGDPGNVTLSGTSSGAACAQMLVMSPLNKNLASKLILQSGNALNTWNVNPTPLKAAFELGRKFGYEGDDKNSLLKLLKAVSAEKLLEAVLEMSDENMTTPRSFSFHPSVEYIKDGAILPDLPSNLWKKVNYVSVINGIAENDGICFLKNPKFGELIVRHNPLKTFISDITSVSNEFLDNMFAEIVSYYGIHEKDDLENHNARMILLTDMQLRYCYTESGLLRPISNSDYLIYNYKFTYCGDHNILSNAWKRYFKGNVEGSFHADDAGYLMVINKWHAPENDVKVAYAVCTLWSNFIKYGAPTGEIVDGTWVSASSDMPCYLEMGEKMTMKNENFNPQRAKFWKYLTDKYFL